MIAFILRLLGRRPQQRISEEQVRRRAAAIDQERHYWAEWSPMLAERLRR